MASPISRIIVLMMENHSFDRMLGWSKRLHPGIEGVDPQHPGSNADFPPSATPIVQKISQARNIAQDPGHDLANVLNQIAGGNHGFIADYAQTYPQAPLAQRQEILGWYDRGFVPGLHYLAENFVIADHWHASLPGPTWPNRFFAHSGTSLGHVDMPEGVFNPGLHFYNQRTLYEELSANKVDWRIYYGDFPQSLVMLNQSEYLGHYSKLANFEADIAKGDLPAYVFIEPAYFGAGENDQHPPHDIMSGDKLIADIFNALQSNLTLFEETLLIILYDEHGGFYDHVLPPATIAPDGHISSFDFKTLGVRVPAVLVSPWLDPGFISPVFDHTSLLKLASELWPGVKPLGNRAAAANSPLAHLNWRSTPRRDVAPAPIAASTPPATDHPSLAGQKQALFNFSQSLEAQIGNPAVQTGLMSRSHEAMKGAFAQGSLAVDRLQAFMTDKQASTAPR